MMLPGFLRWPLALAAVAVLTFGAGYWLGARDARHRAAAEAALDHIDTRERVDDALVRPDGCAWFDRLRQACE
ncbi:MAG: hypothetical protein ACU0A5_14095 [Salipiger marinus]|uniref:hypothetical protein n=1 Tax=Salipiger marinus TaxID=555512 RepID=UPI0040588A87